jgi:hypothetical protein
MSTFWKKVSKEINTYNTSINKNIGYENNNLFWKDKWNSECALSSQFPLLFELASN